MKILNKIEIISAPSILGLRLGGVEHLAKSLLDSGLLEKLKAFKLTEVPTLNEFYNNKRDPETNCLNPNLIYDFSLTLSKAVSNVIARKHFPFVLGGDCSIILGVMSSLKSTGTYGLLFLDAHADFYEPEKSITGEVADMDLAIVTGRGPELLTNINNLSPYVKDENVIHIGQRDWEETQKYGSADFRETMIKCFSYSEIEKKSIKVITGEVVNYMSSLEIEGFWIHFDTDVLSDEINPAVDYRLPGGLQFEETEKLIKSLLLTGKIAGISVTIFNPELDKNKHIAKNIVACLGKAFRNRIII